MLDPNFETSFLGAKNIPPLYTKSFSGITTIGSSTRVSPQLKLFIKEKPITTACSCPPVLFLASFSTIEAPVNFFHISRAYHATRKKMFNTKLTLKNLTLKIETKKLEFLVRCATLRSMTGNTSDMIKDTQLNFNIKKYIENNYSDLIGKLVPNFKQAEIIANGYFNNTENEENVIDSVNTNYRHFVVNNINKIDCKKKEYNNNKTTKLNKEVYLGVENERFIMIANNSFPIKKNLHRISIRRSFSPLKRYSKENATLHIEGTKEKEHLKSRYRFLVSKTKIEEIKNKLNVLMSKTENKSFNEFYFDIVNTCLNSKETSYLLFKDKNNKKNDFVLFKLYYIQKYYETGYKEVIFCDVFVLFFNKFDENEKEPNFVVFRGVIFEKKKFGCIDEELKNAHNVEFYKLKKFDDFSFDYFDAILNLSSKNRPGVFCFSNIDKFDAIGFTNLKYLKIEKNIQTIISTILEKGLEVFCVFENENNEHVKILVEKREKKSTYDVDIYHGYFKEIHATSTVQNNYDDSFYNYQKQIFFPHYQKHKVLGPAKIYFSCTSNGLVDSVTKSYCYFYIDDIYYKLKEYIDKTTSIVDKKAVMNFMLRYVS